METDFYTLLGVNGSYNIFRDINQMTGNIIAIAKLEGEKKFFDKKSLTVAAIYKDSTYLCFGWSNDAFSSVALKYPRYDGIEYKIEGVVFRDAVLNEPSREVILVFRDGTAAFYTGFAPLLMRKSNDTPLISPKRTVLSPLEVGDTVSFVQFIDPFIYVGTKHGLVYSYTITSNVAEFSVIPIHIKLATEKRGIGQRLKGLFMDEDSSSYRPFTTAEIAASRERGEVVYIGAHNNCIFIVHTNSIIFSNQEHKFFEFLNDGGTTNIHGAIDRDRVFLLSRREFDSSVFIQEYLVDNIKRVVKSRAIDNLLFSSAKYVELTSTRVYIIGGREIITAEIDDVSPSEKDIVTLDLPITGYQLYSLADNKSSLISEMCFKSTKGLFRGSEIALATGEEVLIHRCGSSFVDSLLLGARQLQQGEILGIATEIFTHQVDIGLARIDIEKIEEKLQEKVTTYSSFMDYIVRSGLYSKLDAKAEKTLGRQKEQLGATKSFVELRHEIDGLFNHIYRVLITASREFEATDEDRYLQDGVNGEDEDIDRDMSAVLKLCNNPSLIHYVLSSASFFEVPIESRLRCVSAILNGCLSSRVRGAQHNSVWVTHYLVTIKEAIHKGIQDITSIPDTQECGSKQRNNRVEGKRAPVATGEVKREIIDISVALVNLGIKVGRILVMCLDIKPVPKFVPMLAKCTNNYDVFIKAKFLNEQDLDVTQILKEQTDYEVTLNRLNGSGETSSSGCPPLLTPERFYDEDYRNKSVDVGRREVSGRGRLAVAGSDVETMATDLTMNDFVGGHAGCKEGTANHDEDEDIISNPKFYSKLLSFLVASKHTRRLMMTKDQGLVKAIMDGDLVKENPSFAVPLIRSVADGKTTMEEYRGACGDVEFEGKREIEGLMSLLTSRE